MTTTTKNSTKTESTVALIDLGQGKTAIVDRVDLPVLLKFKWRAVKANRNWYVKATIYKSGEKIDICMHRFLARTKFPMVTHHINHNSLDNRRANLENMTQKDHTAYHQMNNIQIKYKDNPTVLFGESLNIPPIDQNKSPQNQPDQPGENHTTPTGGCQKGGEFKIKRREIRGDKTRTQDIAHYNISKPHQYNINITKIQYPLYIKSGVVFP